MSYVLHYTRFFLILFFLPVLFLTAPHRANALEDKDYSESEKAGFAFYHYAKTDPDFESWIKNYDYYKKAKPSKKNKILYDEKNRLTRGIQTFDPDHDYIRFTTDARIHTPRLEERSEYLRKYNKIPVRVELPRLLEIPGADEHYFPIYIGNIWLAMIPENFNKLTTIYMDEEEFYEFSYALDMDRQTYIKPVKIEYTLRTTNADTKEPFPIGKNNFWLIMTEIGGIQIRSQREDTKVWSYEAPWYIPKVRQNLMNLYGQ